MACPLARRPFALQGPWSGESCLGSELQIGNFTWHTTNPPVVPALVFACFNHSAVTFGDCIALRYLYDMFSPSCAFASKGAFTTIGCFRAAFRLALSDFGCCNVLIGDLSKHFWHKIKNHTVTTRTFCKATLSPSSRECGTICKLFAAGPKCA